MNLTDHCFYVYSCDLDVEVQVKVGSLEGKFEKPRYDQLLNEPSLQHCVCLHDPAAAVSAGNHANGSQTQSCPELFVECELFSDNRRSPLPVSTSYKSFTTRYNWNEWLTLPVRYNELSRDARLTFTVFDLHDRLERHVVGGTTINLFSKHGVFRQGMYDLKIWPFVPGDGLKMPSGTPGKTKADKNDNQEITGKCQMNRLAKLSKKHRSGMMEKVDWLDRLTFREIELVNEQEKRSANSLFLMVEFPFVHYQNNEYVIVYFEKNADDYTYFQPYPSLVTSPDPELGLDNLVEAKHHLLARSARIGVGDRELKPNAHTRDVLNAIAEYPTNMDLSSEEKDLLWKFRFFLQSNKAALTKFVQCVNWDLVNEAKQAVELFQDWAPMDVDAALELLSAKFTHPAVRRYAVGRLKEASNDDLLLYLPQLVQALKYENFDTIHAGADTSFVQEMIGTIDKTWKIDSDASGQHRCSVDIGEDANIFDSVATTISHHVVSDQQTIRNEDESMITTRSTYNAAPAPVSRNEQQLKSPDNVNSNNNNAAADDETSCNEESGSDLATFLIHTSCKDPILANYFYWYLKVECDSCAANSALYETSSSSAANQQSRRQLTERDGRIKEMYATVMSRLSKALAKGGVEARRRRAQLVVQQRFVNRLEKIMSAVMKESGNRKKKIEFLQHMLSEHDDVVNFASLDALPLPLDPTVKIQSVMPDKALVFNSANMPAKLTFKTVEGREYTTIFKHGDDLRQDQLIVQIVMIMDKCLRKENLDLKLTPYKVLATSTTQGFVQFVDSQPLRDVLHTWNSVQDYFRHFGASSTGPYGVEPEILDNYVKSCAGYSVISYILGIGDRHQHNLMLCRNGRLFHIDFGYILGRDPKPIPPPPMKLTKEMIEGMGGIGSAHFQEFRTLCYTGFLHLRRHANLFLNLFALMIDASIPDIAMEPDKAVKKVQERFLLHLNDEEAVRSIQQLIDDSISAKMAFFVDVMHDVAQYLRA